MLSLVIASYEMGRELPRTLATFSPSYQIGIAADDYEVIVVDNGSERTPRVSDFEPTGLDLHVLRYDGNSPSPVRAVNLGLNRSVGKYVGVFIDGARMLSPGVLHTAVTALDSGPRVVVATRGRYLGRETQRVAAALHGYGQAAEDELLSSVPWRDDGYRLFEISTFDESSGPTWFDPIAESNGLFMSRALWAELGGFDEQFEMPGGGLVNLDTWQRACALPDVRVVQLLGEATFHQYHGGVATNGSLETIEEFYKDFEAIRATEFAAPTPVVSYVGGFRFPPSPAELVGPPRIRRGSTPRPPRRRAPDRLTSRLPGRVRVLADRATNVVYLARQGQLREELRRRRQAQDDATLLRSSNLFDADWYSERYPDVTASGADPAFHYALYGGEPVRHPGPAFDAEWYLEFHRDVDEGGWNPLLHFLRHGQGENRPIRRFDSNHSSAQAADRDLIARSEYFDDGWYVEQYPKVSGLGVDPLDHYVTFGARRGYHPNQNFDAVRYQLSHPHSQVAQHRPLAHFLLFDLPAGAEAHPVDQYEAQRLLEDGRAIESSGFMDAAWYTARYLSATTTNFSPAEHYLLFGARRGWNPGPNFDSAKYCADYPDVVEAGLNPLLHYVYFGLAEGRIVDPVPKGR